MLDNLKDKIEGLKEVQFSAEAIKGYIMNIEKKKIVDAIIIIFIIIGLFIIKNIYISYKEYKLNYTTYKILEYNNAGLLSQYNNFKNNKKKIDQIERIKGIYKPSITRLYCVFNSIKNKINKKDDIFRKHFIANMSFSEKNNKFKIDIQGIKYYNDLILFLYYMRRYKDILEINYNIKLIEVNNGGLLKSYYTVQIDGDYLDIYTKANQFSIFKKQINTIIKKKSKNNIKGTDKNKKDIKEADKNKKDIKDANKNKKDIKEADKNKKDN